MRERRLPIALKDPPLDQCRRHRPWRARHRSCPCLRCALHPGTLSSHPTTPLGGGWGCPPSFGWRCPLRPWSTSLAPPLVIIAALVSLFPPPATPSTVPPPASPAVSTSTASPHPPLPSLPPLRPHPSPRLGHRTETAPSLACQQPLCGRGAQGRPPGKAGYAYPDSPLPRRPPRARMRP